MDDEVTPEQMIRAVALICSSIVFKSSFDATKIVQEARWFERYIKGET